MEKTKPKFIVARTSNKDGKFIVEEVPVYDVSRENFAVMFLVFIDRKFQLVDSSQFVTLEFAREEEAMSGLF